LRLRLRRADANDLGDGVIVETMTLGELMDPFAC